MLVPLLVMPSGYASAAFGIVTVVVVPARFLNDSVRLTKLASLCGRTNTQRSVPAGGVCPSLAQSPDANWVASTFRCELCRGRVTMAAAAALAASTATAAGAVIASKRNIQVRRDTFGP